MRKIGWLSAKETYGLITIKTWPYKSTAKEELIKRDRALMAIDFVGAFRNNEPLAFHTNPISGKEEKNPTPLKKKNFEETPNMLILHGGNISKRAKRLLIKHGGRITIREDIAFPKYTHPLQPFTDLVLNYLETLEPEDVLFPFGERRHHQIVYAITGLWPHSLRALGENWVGHNIFRGDPFNMAKWVGVLNIQSILPYIGLDESDYVARLKKASFTDNR